MDLCTENKAEELVEIEQMILIMTRAGELKISSPTSAVCHTKTLKRIPPPHSYKKQKLD